MSFDISASIFSRDDFERKVIRGKLSAKWAKVYKILKNAQVPGCFIYKDSKKIASGDSMQFKHFDKQCKRVDNFHVSFGIETTSFKRVSNKLSSTKCSCRQSVIDKWQQKLNESIHESCEITENRWKGDCPIGCAIGLHVTEIDNNLGEYGGLNFNAFSDSNLFAAKLKFIGEQETSFRYSMERAYIVNERVRKLERSEVFIFIISKNCHNSNV